MVDLRDGREPRPRRQRRLALDDRQGRRRGGHGRRGHRRHGPLRRRRLARGADRAAGDPRRVAGRPRHDLVVHAGAVRGAVGRRRDARHVAEPGPGDRAAPRRRLRREVRARLRAAGRGPRQGGRPAGQGRLLAAPGVPAARPPPRTHDHGADDRGPDGRDDRGPAGTPDHRQRRVQHGRAVPRPDGGDVRGRAVPDPARRRRGRCRLHEHAAVGLGPRADGPDDLLGARAAPRRRRRAGRPRPRRVPAPQPRARGRRGTDRPGLRADRRHRDPGARGGGDRLGPAARGWGGGRDRDRLVAVVPGRIGRAPDHQRRRQRDDRDRRPGMRHRFRDGPADPGRRGPRDAAGRVQDPLPGHGRGAVRRWGQRLADDLQQRPRGDRRRERDPRAAPRPGRGLPRGEPGRPRACRRHGPGQGQPDLVGHHRRPRVGGGRRRPAARPRLGSAAAHPGGQRRQLRRSSRWRVVRRADVLHPRGPRQGRSRHRRRPGPGDRGIPRIRHGHQPDRGRGPDPRWRGDGDRPGPQRGRPTDRGRPAAQPVSASTTSSRPRPTCRR